MNLATHTHKTAGDLYSAGAVMTAPNPADPKNPIVYMAAHGKDMGQPGGVTLTMTPSSEKALDKPAANNKYADLGKMGLAAKPSQAAAQLQTYGQRRHAALAQKAGLSFAPKAQVTSLKTMASPAPKAVAKPSVTKPPVTTTMAVSNLAVRKEEPSRNSNSLAGRYQHWAASYGFAHHLVPAC